MIKYLWELEINNIPLGWESIYQEALVKFPNGEIVSIPESNYDEFTTNQYSYHPVKYRNELYRLFNEYKLKAKILFEAKENYEFKPFINQLIQYDCALYNILAEWTLDNEAFDGSNLDTSYIKNVLQDFSGYFNLPTSETDFEQYSKYKLINL